MSLISILEPKCSSYNCGNLFDVIFSFTRALSVEWIRSIQSTKAIENTEFSRINSVAPNKSLTKRPDLLKF